MSGKLERSEEIVRKVVQYSQDWTYMTLGDVRDFVKATQDLPGGAAVSVVGVQNGFFTAITATHREEMK